MLKSLKHLGCGSMLWNFEMTRKKNNITYCIYAVLNTKSDPTCIINYYRLTR